MIGDIIVCFALQIVFTIGVITLYGLLIAICNKIFYANFGHYGRAVCYITGAIGTPLHECAHALFCVIFGHKVTEIKLFQINSADGTLGYVNHSYNPKKIYHRIGNYFIGVAPIIVISAVLYLIASLLLPSFISEVSNSFKVLDYVSSIGNVFKGLANVLQSFFSYTASWQWWVFIIISIFLSLHMTLSRADIKGSLSGVFILLLTVLIVDVILGIINESLLDSFTLAILSIAGYLLTILNLSLIVSVIAVIISYGFRIIKRRYLV